MNDLMGLVSEYKECYQTQTWVYGEGFLEEATSPTEFTGWEVNYIVCEGEEREILKEEQIACMETDDPSMLWPGHHPLWLE